MVRKIAGGKTILVGVEGSKIDKIVNNAEDLMTGDEFKEKSQAVIDEVKARVDNDESFPCVVCGQDEEALGEDTVTITEVAHNYEISVCCSCASGLAVSLLMSLPDEYQRGVVERFVLGTAEHLRENSDLSAALAGEITSFFLVIDPDRATVDYAKVDKERKSSE